LNKGEATAHKGEATTLPARVAAHSLRPYPPFDSMGEETLQWIGERASLAYFHKGEELVGPAAGTVNKLHIVKQGVVHVRASADLPREELADLVHGSGECFPVDALLGRRATAYHYIAAGDVFTYELDEDDVRSLLDMSPTFRAFCTDHLAALVEQSRRVLRAQAGEKLLDEGRWMAPLSIVCSKPALTCLPGVTIREALGAMRAHRVGSMVIADEAKRPLGIFTNVDLLERVTLAEKPLDAPIGEVMSSPVETVEAAAPAHAAAEAMARCGVRHVVVVEDGHVFGVVSERDLYAMQRISAGRAAKAIRRARDFGELARASQQVRELAGQLLAQGTNATQLGAIISSLNDALVQGAVRIAHARHELRARYCWLAFGSEGRSEQTLATDQDNGLILDEDANPAAFLAFAAEVNEALDRCGFPLCKGGVMARNPRWCLKRSEWRAAFGDWIENPVPEALLGAAIFFDLRGIAGEPQFAGELRDDMLARATRNRAFLRAMADNALRSRPPLGLLGGLETEPGGDFRGTLDLKANGSRLFVDAARVWSLAHRLPQSSTTDRLTAAALAGALPTDEAAAAIEAFRVVQALRLRHQIFEPGVAGAENRVSPDALNALERRVLKEAIRHAGRLQQRLRLDFAL
jgi:CBS domain-containing protein